MGKMTIVSRKKLEEGMRKFKERLAKDPRLQEEQKEMKRFMEEEDARLKAEYDAKKSQKNEGG